MRKELNISKKLKRPRKHSLERYFNPNLISVIYRHTHIHLQAPKCNRSMCASKSCTPVSVVCASKIYIVFPVSAPVNIWNERW